MRVALGLLAVAGALTAGSTPTFNKDVVPILQARCQTCHRPGEIGPMSFLTYKETRPWAKAIKQAVATKKMPPWFADPAHGKFANDRSMPKSEIETLVAWADAGAPEGNARDKPQDRQWVAGWNMQTPDAVIEMPTEFPVPAEGKVDYQYIVVPTNFTEDKWVQMVEARPSAPQVVHHVVVYVREPNSKWLRGEAQPGVPFVPPKTTADGRPRADISGAGSDILFIYVPGNSPDIFPNGRAKKIPAGSDLVFQMHYTASGKAAKDRTRLGLVFHKGEPKERVITAAFGTDRFVIPPGDPFFPVTAKTKLPRDFTILSFFPHMHLRGKEFRYRVQRPDQQEMETLLYVKPYNFNWQLTYKLEQPVFLPSGTTMEVTGWFDNSPNNPFNPDPKSEVRFGEQSWEEMMIGFFDVVADAKMERRDLFRPPSAAPAQPRPSAE